MVTGASNVSNAMAFGKQAARNIDRALMEANRWHKLFPEFEFEQAPPEEPDPSRRHTGSTLPVGISAHSFDEVVLGLNQAEAHEEACRCLRCDVKTSEAS